MLCMVIMVPLNIRYKLKNLSFSKAVKRCKSKAPHVVEGPAHPVYDRVQKNKLYNAWKYVIIFLIIS